MIPSAYKLMCGEPWCMRPWEVARLTDFQIIHLYVLPAKERAEAMTKNAGTPGEAAPQQPDGPPPAPSKLYVVSTLMQIGFSREQAEQEYELQKAKTEEMNRGK